MECTTEMICMAHVHFDGLETKLVGEQLLERLFATLYEHTLCVQAQNIHVHPTRHVHHVYTRASHHTQRDPCLYMCTHVHHTTPNETRTPCLHTCITPHPTRPMSIHVHPCASHHTQRDTYTMSTHVHRTIQSTFTPWVCACVCALMHMN